MYGIKPYVYYGKKNAVINYYFYAFPKVLLSIIVKNNF